MWDRRAFLKSAGLAFAASLAPAGAAALERADGLYASAGRRADGGFGAALFTERGKLVQVLDLPGRGHDVCQCPTSGRLAVFARRPGNFALIFNPTSGAQQMLTSPAGRHFYGHGQFSADGLLLYATENDFENARGKVGIYDASDRFQRIGEWDTGGIGPHELLFNGDQSLLCVANGGIETHPDFGRAKLNIATMQPSLSWIETGSGTIIAQHFLEGELHKLSTRHLALGDDGRIWFGAQDQATEKGRPRHQLLGSAAPDAPLSWVDMPEDALGALAGYIGSVAYSPESGHLSVSSPRGNIALVLDQDGNLLQRRAMADVCGLAAKGRGFLASSGLGALQVLGGGSEAGGQAEFAFDNHMLSVSAL